MRMLQRRRSFSAVDLAGLILLLASCGGDSGTDQGSAADLEGTWTYFEDIANSGAGYQCTDLGILELTQSNAALEGSAEQQGQCNVPGDSVVANSGTAPVTSGLATLESVQFGMAGCQYGGDLFGTPPDSMSGDVSCALHLARENVNLQGTWFAVRGVDLQPPTVSGTFAPPAGDTVLVPSDQLSITINASDDRKVAWVGYRLGSPVTAQDSVRVDAPNGARTLQAVVGASDVGTKLLAVFARDGLGRLSETEAGNIRIVDAVRRPEHRFALGGQPTDMVYDDSRNTLYVVIPAKAEIAVIDLSTWMLRAPIPLPPDIAVVRTTNIDITPDKASLLVVPCCDRRLLLVALPSGTITTRLVDGPDYITSPAHVAANGKAFFIGQGSGPGFSFFGLWEHDIAAGTSRRRMEVGFGGNIGGMPELGRAIDQSRLILLDINTACAHVYAAATDQFTPCGQIGFWQTSTPTADLTGNRWLLRHLLADATPQLLGTVRPHDPGAGTIAPDGNSAWYPFTYGIEQVNVTDGGSLGRIRVYQRVSRVSILPEGRRLVGWRDPNVNEVLDVDQLTIVELP